MVHTAEKGRKGDSPQEIGDVIKKGRGEWTDPGEPANMSMKCL